MRAIDYDDPIPQCASAMLPPHETGDSAGSYGPLREPGKKPWALMGQTGSLH